VQKNERYLAFSLAVSQAFLEVSDLRSQFFLHTFSREFEVQILQMCTPGCYFSRQL
jgi:hypothetical protein